MTTITPPSNRIMAVAFGPGALVAAQRYASVHLPRAVVREITEHEPRPRELASALRECLEDFPALVFAFPLADDEQRKAMREQADIEILT